MMSAVLGEKFLSWARQTFRPGPAFMPGNAAFHDAVIPDYRDFSPGGRLSIAWLKPRLEKPAEAGW